VRLLSLLLASLAALPAAAQAAPEETGTAAPVERPAGDATAPDDAETLPRSIAAPLIDRVPEIETVIDPGLLDRWLPAPFFELGLFDIQLWQWLGLGLLLLVAWAYAWLLTRLALLALGPLAA
jgi:hypothetical protein